MRKTIILWMLTLCSCTLCAQRFGAAVVVGPTLSQVLGEGNAGFDKVGVTGGLQGIAYLSDRFDLHVDLLYSQAGSRASLFPRELIERTGFDLDYIEVPVSIMIKDWIQESEDGIKYGKLGLYAGGSFARLVRSKAIGFEPGAADQISSNKIALHGGLRLQWSRNWAANVRYTRAIRAVSPSFEPDELDPLYPYSIQIRIEYIL